MSSASSSSSDGSKDSNVPATVRSTLQTGDGVAETEQNSTGLAKASVMFSSSEDSSSDSNSSGSPAATAAVAVNFGSDSSGDDESSSESSDGEQDTAERGSQSAPASQADIAAVALMESSSEDEAVTPNRQVSLTKVPYVKDPGMKQACIVRLPNAIAIRTDEFSQDTYDEVEEETYLKKRGRLLAFRSEAIIRWQYVLDEHGNRKEGPDGKPLRESNARIVEWSDGSRTLFVGNQPLDMNLEDATSERLYLTTQHSNDFMETVDSIGHRALITVPKAVTDVALSEIRQGEKRQRTALAFVVTDLEKDQERRAKAVDEAGRQKKREEGKKTRGKRAGGIRPEFLEEGAASVGYKRDYVRVTELSEDEGDESDVEDDDSGIDEDLEEERPKSSKRGRKAVVNDSSSPEEEEAESSSSSSSSSSSESESEEDSDD